jgi:hypothetical protein
MDLAFHLALIIRVLMKLRTGQFDIETAFLFSDLDEEIYMRIPEGYVRYMLAVHHKKINPSTHTHVLLLTKAIYRPVQAARQWWKKINEAMAGCNPKKTDRCLCTKKANGDDPLSFVIFYF